MPSILELENRLTPLIEEALRQLKATYNLSEDLPKVSFEIPRQQKFGDISTNIALQIAKQTKQLTSQQLANFLTERIRDAVNKSKILKSKIEEVKVAPPGFINFFLTKEAFCGVLYQISKKRQNFGGSDIGGHKKIQVEFVSANPTGPLTIAHGRQAAVGDALANILQFCSYRVTREYYLNDEGRQIELLGRSIYARYLQILEKAGIDFPQDGYKGKYIYAIAEQLVKKYKQKFIPFNERNIKFFTQFGIRSIMKTIKKDLQDFGVKFNCFTSQARLRKAGKIRKSLIFLEKSGFVYQKDNALWFKSTQLGDDKDRVLIKNDGSYTYITPDIAYHKDKFERGFKRIIDIWGPDHHGYIPRMYAAIKALGYEPQDVSIIIVQLVTLLKAGQPLPMSTRGGEFITLRELTQEVGRDAARFFFLMRKTDSHLDFDLELAKQKSQENPVYYIQYAHARICGILEFKKSKMIRYEKKMDISLLKQQEELDILAKLSQFPDVINQCAAALDPHRLTTYLMELAGIFHLFYTKHRVISEDPTLTKARLELVDCMRIVLANGLGLLGVSCPSKM